MEALDVAIIVDSPVNNLQISEDDMGMGPIAVFLYTPDMNDRYHNHFHIELTVSEARNLHAWLDKFLQNKLDGEEVVLPGLEKAAGRQYPNPKLRIVPKTPA